jgi:hypothetical protein
MIQQQLLQNKLAQQKSQAEFYGKVIPAIIRGQYQQRAITAASERAKELLHDRENSENARALFNAVARQKLERQRHMDEKDLAWLNHDLADRHAEYVLRMAVLNPNILTKEMNDYRIKAQKAESDAELMRQKLIADRDAYQNPPTGSRRPDDDPELVRRNHEIYQKEKDIKGMKDTNSDVIKTFERQIKLIGQGGGGTSGTTPGQPGAAGGGTYVGAAPTSGEASGPADAVEDSDDLYTVFKYLWPESDVVQPRSDEPSESGAPNE